MAEKFKIYANWREVSLRTGRLNSQVRIFLFIIHQIFLLLCDWSKRIMWLNMPQLKLGNVQVTFPIFQNHHGCVVKNIRRIILNTIASISHKNMLRYYFVLGRYLFLKTRCFPWAKVLENCLLFRTDNVHCQISEYIWTPNGGYCLHNFMFGGGVVFTWALKVVCTCSGFRLPYLFIKRLA